MLVLVVWKLVWLDVCSTHSRKNDSWISMTFWYGGSGGTFIPGSGSPGYPGYLVYIGYFYLRKINDSRKIADKTAGRSVCKNKYKNFNRLFLKMSQNHSIRGADVDTSLDPLPWVIHVDYYPILCFTSVLFIFCCVKHDRSVQQSAKGNHFVLIDR